jgi:uncharacterized membrane protein YwzB
MEKLDKLRNFFFLILFTITCLSAPILAFSQSAHAQETRSIFKPENRENINKTTESSVGDGYNKERSLEDIIASVIQLVLSVLGIIFIVLMFLTGNEWMQAAGNEEKIKKAKTRIQQLLIGLIFILLAYAVSSGFSGMLVKVLIKK